MITRQAIEGLKEWLRFCQENGWGKKAVPQLTDLWWQWHGDDGQLLARPRQGSGVSEEARR